MKMKGVIEVCLFPFTIYLGVGFYYTNIEFIQLIGLTITFCFGIYIFYYLYYFYKYGIGENAKVIKKTKAPSSGDDMTMTFYFIFLVKNKEYTPRYSYNLGPKENSFVKVITIEKENRVLPLDRYYWFLFYGIGSVISSLFFYYIKIMNINL